MEHETPEIIWKSLENTEKRLNKIERLVEESVPRYVADRDKVVRKLIERVVALEKWKQSIVSNSYGSTSPYEPQRVKAK